MGTNSSKFDEEKYLANLSNAELDRQVKRFAKYNTHDSSLFLREYYEKLMLERAKRIGKKDLTKR